jgi:hypothetical protein
MLAELGYAKLAEVVGRHMDLGDVRPDQPLDEAQVVYLADKLVQGERIVALRERFAPGLARFSEQPAAFEGVTRRLRTAEVIQARIEAALGIPLQALSLLGGTPAQCEADRR